MAEDIRRTGPIGLRGIPGLNRQSDPLEQDMRDANICCQQSLICG